MKIIATGLRVMIKLFLVVIIILICSGLLFVINKGSQSMQVSEAPEGMTYFEFMADRIDAARIVEPSRCGWGMFASLFALGPAYSVVYTEVGIHPDGFLAKWIASDSDIPADVRDAEWHEIPGIWWHTVERLSWTMLGKETAFGCQFREVDHELYNQ